MEATPNKFNRGDGYASQLNRHSACPWWDEDCEKLIKQIKEALKKFRNCRTWENFIDFKRNKAKTRSGLRKIKKDSFKKFCENLRKDTNPTQIWNTIKGFKNR